MLLLLILKSLSQHYFKGDRQNLKNSVIKTALKRAIARNQEGLSSDKIKQVYDEIFFPAQKLHVQKDNPQIYADIIFNNDYNH